MSQQLLENIPALRRYALSLTGSVHDADDLLQSALERALSRNAPSGDELVKWLFRVCRNLWIDNYRAAKTRMDAANDPQLEENSFDGNAQTENTMMLERVSTAMNQLHENQRSILALVAVEGKSYKEVAELLGIPQGTVMSRLARARSNLNKILNDGDTRGQVHDNH